MNVDIHSRNMTLSERMEDYANKKLQKLERYLPNIMEASLELRKENSKSKEQIMAQLTVRNSRGMLLRSEDKKQADVFAAIDVVVDKLYRQIRQYKSKSRRKGSDRFLENEAAWEGLEDLPSEEIEIEDYDNEGIHEIIRRKEVSLTPMSEQEAIDQMELLGHDFFLFYNGTEDTVNVLYRRKDGQYGILTPRHD
jgi:putative sigma-54 modulation protein